MLPIALLAALAAPAPAAEAEAFIRRGIDLRRKGEDGAALEEFRRAYELAPTPRAAAQMGLAAQAVERWLDAEAHLAEALRARSDPWIRRNRAVLEDSLRAVRGRIGRLVVGGSPAGADVFVNGENVGRLPLAEPARVLPGPVQVELRSPGYVSAATTVTVAAGQQAYAEIRLERERPAPEVPLPASPPPPQVVILEKPAAPPPPSLAPSPGLRAARWVALGLTGVALAVGAAGVVTHEQKIADFNGRCGLDEQGQPMNTKAGITPQGCGTLLDRADTGRKVAVAGFVGAGLLAVTSAVLFIAF